MVSKRVIATRILFLSFCFPSIERANQHIELNLATTCKISQDPWYLLHIDLSLIQPTHLDFGTILLKQPPME